MGKIILGDGNFATEGDRVRVTSGAHAGEVGYVEMFISTQTSFGYYELVWVRLTGARVACKPEELAKVNDLD